MQNLQVVINCSLNADVVILFHQIDGIIRLERENGKADFRVGKIASFMVVLVLSKEPILNPRSNSEDVKRH